jgi:hypothetical protein
LRRRGETVLEKLGRLRGAALDSFLNKWVTWISSMIPSGVDPSVVVEDPKVTPDTVVKLFKQYCPDLEESECYDRLMEVIAHSRVARRSVFDPQFIRDFERKATVSAAVSKILNLDWEVNPSVADDLYRAIFDERDVARACELVRYDVAIRWASIGEEPPAEELALADRVCERIKELVARRAPPVEWWRVLEPVFRTREELEPSIKPYIMRVRTWGIHKDLESLARQAGPGELRLLAGAGAVAHIR